MNFTTFWSLHDKWRQVLDPKQSFIPMQSQITIYNNSHLYINLDGCVNTLRGECRQFLHSHGKDGRNQTSQSRFHCFYNKVNYNHYPYHNKVEMRISFQTSGGGWETLSIFRCLLDVMYGKKQFRIKNVCFLL